MVLVLREREAVQDAAPRIARKLQLRHGDLFNEKDYEQSLG